METMEVDSLRMTRCLPPEPGREVPAPSSCPSEPGSSRVSEDAVTQRIDTSATNPTVQTNKEGQVQYRREKPEKAIARRLAREAAELAAATHAAECAEPSSPAQSSSPDPKRPRFLADLCSPRLRAELNYAVFRRNSGVTDVDELTSRWDNEVWKEYHNRSELINVLWTDVASGDAEHVDLARQLGLLPGT